jgi:hypothetical protein
MMRYFYTAAWVVVGGISLRQDSSPIELASSKDYRFLLTSDPDAFLSRVDEGSAIGRLMLKGLAGQRGDADFRVALAAESEEIRARRKKIIGGQAVLVFQAQGEIDATLNEPFREHEEFIVTFDAVDKHRVRQRHQADIEAMKVAVSFERDVSSLFVGLADGTYLLNEAGKIVHSISFSVGGDASFSTSLSDEVAKRISTRYSALKAADDISSVERLIAQMAEYGTDRFKTFLSGWAALEIFIAKSFKSYERAFLSPFTNADQPTLRERFLERIKDVMKDKYQLADKFIAVTAVLFPGASNDDVQQDYQKFRELKGLRDKIYHGEPFSEKELPVNELAGLLRKYVLARLSTPSQAINAEAIANGTPSNLKHRQQ